MASEKVTNAAAALLLVLSVLQASTAQAYDFYVGGRDGWVLRPSESFNNWANRNRFQVNDHLVFNYKKGVDSVLAVRERNYHSCNLTHPIKKMDSGSSRFTLDRPGSFYFVSGVPGCCEEGQKLVVVVMTPRRRNPKSATFLAGFETPATTYLLAPGHNMQEAMVVTRSSGGGTVEQEQAVRCYKDICSRNGPYAFTCYCCFPTPQKGACFAELDECQESCHLM